jgi:hypothetical protein
MQHGRKKQNYLEISSLAVIVSSIFRDGLRSKFIVCCTKPWSKMSIPFFFPLGMFGPSTWFPYVVPKRRWITTKLHRVKSKKGKDLGFFYHDTTAVVGQELLNIEDSQSHSDTQHSVGLLWTSDQPDTVIYTWQHTTLTRDRHPWPRLDSNPQSQQARGNKPTP